MSFERSLSLPDSFKIYPLLEVILLHTEDLIRYVHQLMLCQSVIDLGGGLIGPSIKYV